MTGFSLNFSDSIFYFVSPPIFPIIPIFFFSLQLCHFATLHLLFLCVLCEKILFKGE